MKRKQVIAMLLAASMTASIGAVSVPASVLDESVAISTESNDDADRLEDETEETAYIDTSEADVEAAYTKEYLFALAEGAALPTEDSGICYLMDNIYLADSPEQIYALYDEADVLYVEENCEVELFADQNDYYYGKQKTYLENVKAEALWRSDINVSDVTVAVIDSGLYAQHRDLDRGRILSGYNYVNENEDTTDSNGHGTQVAGVIAAVRNNGIGVVGLLDHVKILPMRISKDDSASPTIAVVANAIKDAVDRYHVDVINMSIGQTSESDTLKAAVEYAAANNVLLVAAAGNTGDKKNELQYPAGYDEVVGVGAVNTDRIVRENSQRNEGVFVTAPGEGIYTLDVNDRYSVKSGTSYAAPFVSAMAAAAKAVRPEMSVAEFQELLKETSVDAGEPGYDTSYGHGVIDMDAFVTKLTGKAGDEPVGVQTVEGGSAFEVKYQRAYGSELTDSFLSAAKTKDGGYVAVGYTFDESKDPAWGYTPAANGKHTNNDAIVVKFDSEARVEWARNFGDTGIDLFMDVDVLEDGTIVAVGRSPYMFGTEKSTVSGYVLRIAPKDPEDYEEIHVGGSKGGDFVEAVTATKDGGYVIAGRTSSYDSKDWTKVHGSTTTADGFIAKYDADGNPVFSKTYSNQPEAAKGTRFLDIAEDANGNLIAVGEADIAKHLQNSVIVQFDGKTGEVKWARSEGTASLQAPKNATEGHTSTYEGVAVLADGSYVVTGTTKVSGSTTGEKNWGIDGDKDGIIVHYTADGTVSFATNIGTASGTVDLSGIAAAPDGGYLVYGQTADEIYGSSVYTWKIKGATDTVVLKFDAEDRLEWNESYGLANHGEWFNSIVVNEDGGVFIAGETNRTNSDGKIDASVWTSFPVEGDPAADADAEQEDVVYADGTYTGSGRGYNEEAPVVVSVTVEGGKLKSVSYVSSQDTSSYMKKARALLTTMEEQQSADVDVVTGATYSSRGLKRAVQDALKQAAKAAEQPSEQPAEKPSDEQPASRQAMYRLYNPNSGEHFYTAKTGERDALVKLGWKAEGIGWYAPATSDKPVYRLYNPNAGDHHYTTSAGERDALVKLGWNNEGIGWYSASEKDGIAVLRQYNPNAKAGAHNFTTSTGERDALVKAGWKAEGTAWFAVK